MSHWCCIVFLPFFCLGTSRRLLPEVAGFLPVASCGVIGPWWPVLRERATVSLPAEKPGYAPTFSMFCLRKLSTFDAFFIFPVFHGYIIWFSIGCAKKGVKFLLTSCSLLLISCSLFSHLLHCIVLWLVLKLTRAKIGLPQMAGTCSTLVKLSCFLFTVILLVLSFV